MTRKLGVLFKPEPISAAIHGAPHEENNGLVHVHTVSGDVVALDEGFCPPDKAFTTLTDWTTIGFGPLDPPETVGNLIESAVRMVLARMQRNAPAICAAQQLRLETYTLTMDGGETHFTRLILPKNSARVDVWLIDIPVCKIAYPSPNTARIEVSVRGAASFTAIEGGEVADEIDRINENDKPKTLPLPSFAAVSVKLDESEFNGALRAAAAALSAGPDAAFDQVQLAFTHAAPHMLRAFLTSAADKKQFMEAVDALMGSITSAATHMVETGVLEDPGELLATCSCPDCTSRRSAEARHAERDGKQRRLH